MTMMLTPTFVHQRKVIDVKVRPRVSAIIIFLNVEKYLAEAIESVFSQSYNDWELLLCDDGSTDGSSDIARRCAERYPNKVKYLEHPGHENRGMSATRNLGLAHASGEYIAWLDADDVWRPHKLEQQVALLDQHREAAMVYGPLELWYSWTGKPEDARRDFLQDLGVPGGTMLKPRELLIHFLKDERYIPSGILVRKAVLEEVGGFEESFRDEFEDVVVHSKVNMHWPVLTSSESWYRYRQHEESCCAETRRVGRESARRLIYLNRLMQYMRDESVDDPALWRTVEEQVQANQPQLRRTLHFRYRQFVENVKERIRDGLRLTRRAMERFMPKDLRRTLGRYLWYRRGATPPPGWVDMGGLGTEPVSRLFGWNRGKPVDRYYVEKFLGDHAGDIRGRVMEVGDAEYTQQFGGRKVDVSDVLHAKPGNPDATLVGDLCTGKGIPRGVFDCMILTQVFAFLYDVDAAIEHAAAALKPGGVMLVTLPGISQISRYDAERWGDYWRFTSMSARKLFEKHFSAGDLEIQTFGNVKAATAMLHGLATQEVEQADLDCHDSDYEMVIAIRARKRVPVSDKIAEYAHG